MGKKKDIIKKKGMKEIPIVVVILIVVGIVVTLIFVGKAMGWFGNAMNTGNKVNDNVSALGTTLDEDKFTDIEGRTISGNEVVSYLRSWKNEDVCVKVVTKSQTGGTYYNFKNFDSNVGITAANKRSSEENSTLISYATNQMQQNYINPNARFKTEIKRNQNDVIVAVVFTQQ